MITPIDVAISQLGIKEATGHNDGIPADRYMRGDKLAWCAGFALWCYDESDWPDIPARARDYWRLRSVQALEDDSKARGFWLGWKLKPEPSDLIFFGDRGDSDRGRGRHVGIVERVDGDTVHTIEGNSGDAVRRKNYKRSNRRITGYARYAADDSNRDG